MHESTLHKLYEEKMINAESLSASIPIDKNIFIEKLSEVHEFIWNNPAAFSKDFFEELLLKKINNKTKFAQKLPWRYESEGLNWDSFISEEKRIKKIIYKKEEHKKTIYKESIRRKWKHQKKLQNNFSLALKTRNYCYVLFEKDEKGSFLLIDKTITQTRNPKFLKLAVKIIDRSKKYFTGIIQSIIYPELENKEIVFRINNVYSI